MSDVFVSYKAEDRRRVEPLVEALRAGGLSVWWDAHLGGGDSWREKIEAELESARCVIVIWSKRSIGPDGHFVRDEASRAQRRHIYLPVLIDRVGPPLGFGETQALSLVRWKGGGSDPRFRAVLDCARSIIAGTPDALRASVRADAVVNRRSVLLGGAAATAVAAGVGGWFLLRPGSASAADSIAVLPFANLSGDPSQSYFSDGIAEELRSVLARIPRVRVIGRTSSEMMRNSDAVTAARKLDVGNIVTGSVRRSASLIRVSAQLVSGKDGVERWSQAYDRAPGDILQIQSDIAKSVADALSLELGRSGGDAGGTDSAGAYDWYLKGIALRERGQNEPDLEAALKYFDSAIRLDPSFADAYAQKSHTLVTLTGVFSNSVIQFDRGYSEAASNARRAIALAPQRALGYSALAAALAGKLDAAGAKAEYERAFQHFGGEVELLNSYSWFMSRAGSSEQAIKAADQAIQADPLNPRPYAMRGTALLFARRYAEAADAFRHANQIARGPSALGFAFLGMCLMMLGRNDEARTEYARAPADNVYRLTGESILEARTGNRAEAERKLTRMRDLFGDSAVYQEAEILAQLGQRDRAIAALERSWDVRDPGLLGLARDPFLDPLRDDPRLAQLKRKLGLPSD